MGSASRALLAAPIEGLPCLDAAGLRHYEASYCSKIGAAPAMTYMQGKKWLEQELAITCSKSTMMHWMQIAF